MYSTESEPISIANVLGIMMLSKYFMDAQDYTIEHNMLYQDNRSPTLLTKNGHILICKASKYIKNQCFLITDNITQDKLIAKHRGTE